MAVSTPFSQEQSLRVVVAAPAQTDSSAVPRRRPLQEKKIKHKVRRTQSLLITLALSHRVLKGTGLGKPLPVHQL